MCVIIYKPKGAQKPSKEFLTKAYQRNPHGCGIVTPTKHYKGLSFASFMKVYNQCGEEEPILIHFRFATHGSIKRSNCHPFYDDETGIYMMHNGVMHGWYSVKGDKTDSEVAFRDYFLPCINRHGYHSEEVKDMVHTIGYGSRFAFMQGDDVLLIGSFYKHDGLYLSNTRFL